MIRLIMLSCAVMVALACSSVDESSPPRHADARSSGQTPILESRTGRASHVARALDGHRTASGGTFDAGALVAAHPSYPFDTVVRVTNLENGRTVEVRIVDRGPARRPREEGVIIDLSRAAADALQFVEDGRANVRLDVLRWGPR